MVYLAQFLRHYHGTETDNLSNMVGYGARAFWCQMQKFVGFAFP